MPGQYSVTRVRWRGFAARLSLVRAKITVGQIIKELEVEKLLLKGLAEVESAKLALSPE